MHRSFNVSRPNRSKLSKNAEENLTYPNYWEKKMLNMSFYCELLYILNYCMHVVKLYCDCLWHFHFTKWEKNSWSKLLRWDSWSSVLSRVRTSLWLSVRWCGIAVLQKNKVHLLTSQPTSIKLLVSTTSSNRWKSSIQTTYSFQMGSSKAMSLTINNRYHVKSKPFCQ